MFDPHPDAARYHLRVSLEATPSLAAQLTQLDADTARVRSAYLRGSALRVLRRFLPDFLLRGGTVTADASTIVAQYLDAQRKAAPLLAQFGMVFNVEFGERKRSSRSQN